MSFLRKYFNSYVIVKCILLGGYHITRWIGLTAYTSHGKWSIQKQQQQQRQQHYSDAPSFYPPQPQSHTTYPSMVVHISRPLRYYTLLTIFITTCALPFVTQTVRSNQVFLRDSGILSIVGYMRYAMLHLFAIAALICQYMRQAVLVTCINRMFELQDIIAILADQLNASRYRLRGIRRRWQCHTNKLEKSILPPLYDYRMAVMLCLKLLILLLSPSWMIYIVYRENVLFSRPGYLAALLCLYYCQLILQSIFFIYYEHILILAQQSHQLNILLKNALKQAAIYLLYLRPFDTLKRNRFNSICAVISKIQYIYKEHCNISRIMFRAYSPHWVSFIGFVLFECTIQLFMFYFASCSKNFKSIFLPNDEADPVVVVNEACRLRLNFAAMIYLSHLMFDVCLNISALYQLEKCIKFTRIILAEGSAELPLPQIMCRQCSAAQLERVLAEFTLYLRMEHQQQHNSGRRYVYFMVCGLFALERSLIFLICETILKYLLLLIQYDIVNK